MTKPKLILFCLVAATLCAYNAKPKQNAPEPPANLEPTAQADVETSKPCGDTACQGDEYPTLAAQTVAPDNQAESPDHSQCGDTVCQYGEICKDNQCKTKFEMNIYLAPIPKEGTVQNDSYDYWECRSETCTYVSDKTYTIPKGIRVREDMAYCGGEGIDLSQMQDYTCTLKGWVCTSKDGCGGCKGECRYGGCTEVTCSPGEKCDNGSGCQYAGATIDNILFCEKGDCECGQNRCGKNQICAYGNCYFAGEIDNEFGDCEFNANFDICGTSDTPEQLVRYLCPKRCPSENPPQNKDGYLYSWFTLGDCHGTDIHLWECQNDAGCECGDKKCPKDASCIDGKCALLSLDEYADDDIAGASECATDYSELLLYLPSDAEHFLPAKLKTYPYFRYWSCNAPNDCICNGEKLLPGTTCHKTSDGTEYIEGIPEEYADSFHRAPSHINNYTYKNYQWVCQNESCLCGEKPLPKNAHCNDDNIYCFETIIPKAMSGYVCDKTDKKWICASEECLCDGKPLPKNAHCKNEKIYCFDDEIPQNNTGYACDEIEKRWVCPSGNCLCDGMELRPGIRCAHNRYIDKDDQICGDAHMNTQAASKHDCIDSKWVINKDYRCCGFRCLATQTASEYDCVDSMWKAKAEDGQRHCQNKLLPKGATCGSTSIEFAYQEFARCGTERLDQWDDYQCENGRWKCALKDRPCTCNGKPLPDGARCIDNNAYCGHNDERSNWDGLSCRNGEWVNDAEADAKSGLCHGHKLREGVTCPSYGYEFTSDVVMSDMESCEHVRGCLCHNALCPPSGICTDRGCIDPLTDKPFKFQDGYLVSDRLRQCANANGCMCGKGKIEYRDYCYNDNQYISMRSCVSDEKRTIAENNYLSYDCEYGDVPWLNYCVPDPDIDPTQYFIRDCLTATPRCFSDRSVKHTQISVCIQKSGCHCIHNTCKYGEACYKGQCASDYTCHDLDYYGDEDSEIGKCRPTLPEG